MLITDAVCGNKQYKHEYTRNNIINVTAAMPNLHYTK